MEMDEDKRGVLDILIVIAENIKLLVFGPLVAGLLAMGIGLMLPKHYVSHATLMIRAPGQIQEQVAAYIPTSTQAAAMMTSPAVLDPVISSLKLFGGEPNEEARKKLASQIKATAGKDGLLHLEVTNPEQTQAIANAVIDSWLNTTKPSKEFRADLEKRIAFTQKAADAVERLILDRLPLVGRSGGIKYLAGAEGVPSVDDLNSQRVRFVNQISSMQFLLQGLSRDVVKQSPTSLDDEPASRSGKWQRFALVAFIAELVLLFWAFMRQAWRDGAQIPHVAEKQARLCAALGLKYNRT